jgi:hypothetical protein
MVNTIILPVEKIFPAFFEVEGPVEAAPVEGPDP